MNKEWAEMNKAMQMQLGRKDTYPAGIDTLLELRGLLMEQIMQAALLLINVSHSMTFLARSQKILISFVLM